MKSHFLRAGLTPRYTYNASYSSGTNSTSYTVTGANIGAADSTRVVVVLVFTSGTTAPTSATATIGGVSANQRRYLTNASGNAAAIFTLQVSSGTTADLVITFNQSMARIGTSVYSVYNTRTVDRGVDGIIESDDDTGNATSGVLTFTNFWPAGAIFIGGYQTFDNLTAPSLPTRTMSTDTNNTVTLDTTIRHGTEGRVHTASSMRFTNDSGTGTRTVTCTYDTTRQYEAVGAIFY